MLDEIHRAGDDGSRFIPRRRTSRAGERLMGFAGTATLVGTTFKTLAENVEQGSRILLSDGLIELRVHEVNEEDVTCDIVNGGMLGENKGINLPGILVRVPR